MRTKPLPRRMEYRGKELGGEDRNLNGACEQQSTKSTRRERKNVLSPEEMQPGF